MLRTTAFLLLAGIALIGCDTADDEFVDQPPAAESVQPAEGAQPPATTIDDVPANDPDTIGWIQRGELLQFGGREWRPVGEPIFNPILRYVGDADGLALYGLPERDPALQLFFHLGGDRWQTLEPVGEGVGGDAGTVRDTM